MPLILSSRIHIREGRTGCVSSHLPTLAYQAREILKINMEITKELYANIINHIKQLEARLDCVEYEVWEEKEMAKPTRATKRIAEEGRTFAKFWEAYPVKKGKGAARLTWDKLKGKEEVLKFCIDAISWQKETRSWREGYIPHPATYISQERWLDEPDIINNQEEL